MEVLHMLDIELLNRFRNQINDNSYYALFRYRNNNNKNHWNLICSCADWISVSIDYINSFTLENNNINDKCLKIYSYVSAIDMTWEAIKQLHRVVINDDKIPFEGNNTVFDSSICKDDNRHFKHIRAVFGAHPVSINDKRGKWFASWPTDHVHHEYDLAVTLYSSVNEYKDEIFGLKLPELDSFIMIRYHYIELIINELETQYKLFCKEKSMIDIDKSDDPIEQLEILKEEAICRGNNSYYKEAIDELIYLFNTESTTTLEITCVKKYILELKKVIEELYNNLQQMKLKELETNNILSPDYPQELIYPISKVFESIRNRYNHVFMRIGLEETQKYIKEYIDIETIDNYDELYLCIKAGLFCVNNYC